MQGLPGTPYIHAAGGATAPNVCAGGLASHSTWLLLLHGGFVYCSDCVDVWLWMHVKQAWWTMDRRTPDTRVRSRQQAVPDAVAPCM